MSALTLPIARPPTVRFPVVREPLRLAGRWDSPAWETLLWCGPESSGHARPRRANSELDVAPRPILTSILFIGIIAAGISTVRATGHGGFAIYGMLLGVLLASKLILSILPSHQWDPDPDKVRLGVVVPLFNEDPNVFIRLLDSLDAQTRPPDIVVIVDDASTDSAAWTAATSWADAHGQGAIALRHDINLGKRHAIATAVRATSADIWMTVDSDTVLEPRAISAGLAPFSDATVQGVTGIVLALNVNNGLLPALQDIRYTNGFLGERAAYSRLGSVLCACGSIAFWRTPVILDNLTDFLNQQFLGTRAETGDDRRLTRYALDRGRVVLARDAIARTTVPERLPHYVRQQVRWGKSFWRESFLMFAAMAPRRISWWLSVIEIVSTVAFTMALIWSITCGLAAGSLKVFAGYAGWVCVSSWARSVHVFTVRGRGSNWQTLAAFAIAPLYGLLSLLLLPLRLYSLVTLRVSGWGTRQHGPETQLAPAP